MGNNNDNNIKFLQVNMAKSKAGVSNLSNILVSGMYDVALIQEPYTVKDEVGGLPNNLKVFQVRGRGEDPCRYPHKL